MTVSAKLLYIRYFGAFELVTIDENHEIPIRIVNPTFKSVKIYAKTKLADLFVVDSNIATFELGATNEQERKSSSENCDSQSAPEDDYSHLPDLSDSILDDEAKIKFRNLIFRFRDIFPKSKSELGRTSLVQHTIDTGDHPPIKQKPYRANPETRKEIDRRVEEMLQNNFIEESTSPWSSPVVMIPKKDGTMRFCVDYRKLNAIIWKDSFPLPLITQTLDSLYEAKLFSTLDMRSGYWQIELHLSAREKTAFVTHNGWYQYLVLPFGLSNSPASFQRLMGHILRGLEYKHALIYIDDIIIFSKSVDELLLHFEDDFQRLREANVKLNPKKCHFAKQQVQYLGHVVTSEGT